MSSNIRNKRIATALDRASRSQQDRDNLGFYFDRLVRRLESIGIDRIPAEVKRRLPGLRKEAKRSDRELWKRCGSIDSILRANERQS